MSVKQMGMVWELDLAPNHRLVLLAYADHADECGNNIFPSLARIAHKTGYSRDQVRRISKELKDAGLMELVEQATHNRPAEYRLTLERGRRLQPLTPRGGGANDPSGVGAPVPPEPSVEPSVEPSSSPPVVPPSQARGDASKRKKGKSSREYAALVERFIEADPLGGKLAVLIELAAEENSSKQITWSRQWNEFCCGIKEFRQEGLSDAQIRHGLSEAIRRGAPNMNYCKKAAASHAATQPPTRTGGEPKEKPKNTHSLRDYIERTRRAS